MELESCICSGCNQHHELCRCDQLDLEYDMWVDHNQSLDCDNIEEYPKIIGEEVEISDGIFIPKSQYDILNID